MHRANRGGTIVRRSSPNLGELRPPPQLATSTQRQNVDCTEVEAGREEEAAVRAGSWLARRGQPAATFCRRACLPKSESDSKCTEWAPPTVGRSSMGARRIQRAMKAQIAPPKVAVEARPCAWAGWATSRGERSRAAGLAPSAERCERPGPSVFDLSVSGRSLAGSEGPGPLNRKQKQGCFSAVTTRQPSREGPSSHRTDAIIPRVHGA